jgi:hypothetical protein
MSADLAALATTPEVTAVGGAFVGYLIKALVERILKRAETLEAKDEEGRDEVIKKLLEQVTGVRGAIELMGERFIHHQASAVETKSRVDDHDERISALEIGHASLKARIEYFGDARDD